MLIELFDRQQGIDGCPIRCKTKGADAPKQGGWRVVGSSNLLPQPHVLRAATTVRGPLLRHCVCQRVCVRLSPSAALLATDMCITSRFWRHWVVQVGCVRWTGGWTAPCDGGRRCGTGGASVGDGVTCRVCVRWSAPGSAEEEKKRRALGQAWPWPHPDGKLLPLRLQAGKGACDTR